MKTEQKKALLVVSFGTSYADTRKKNIEHVESVLKNAFPDRCFYHAYTSQMILDKLRNRDHIFIPNVKRSNGTKCIQTVLRMFLYSRLIL